MGKYLIVGAGLFGSTLANLLHSAGHSVLVVEKEDYFGGTCRTYESYGIDVHMYGAHIFKTNDTWVWNYVNQFAEFKPFINTPIAISRGEAFNLPFNMNTFARLWNVRLPIEAQMVVGKQILDAVVDKKLLNEDGSVSNLEVYALSHVGRDIYERFIKGYTEKQWGKPCTELPSSLLGRLKMRYTYNNNYYDVKYQGVPIGGYSQLSQRMLRGVDVKLGCDGKKYVKSFADKYDKIIYTGMIDEFFDNCYGRLEYRSLEFKTVVKDCKNYQGNAVLNYTDADIPFTRVIEHNHFLEQYGEKSVVTYEYPANYVPADNKPYYPVPTEKNKELYDKYLQLAKDSGIIFSGRLGSYTYTDMAETVRNAKNLYDKLIKEDKE